MDQQWAEEVLTWWIRKATAAKEPRYSFGLRGPLTDELKEREHQTRSVVGRVIGGSKPVPPLAPEISDQFVELLTGIDLVKYALGQLRTEGETRRRLGTSAPLMAADSLHPLVWRSAEGLWSDGHHDHAVQRAATFINAHVQDLSGRHDVSDASLMQQVFSPSPPEEGKPRLRWPGEDTDLTVRAMRSGILSFSAGVFMAIRNPATHGTGQSPKQICLEHLATLSTLARWIDGCELVEVSQNG